MSATVRQELEAVFQGGVFRPLTRPALSEGAQVHLVVETVPLPTDPLELAGLVYDDIAPELVDEIETLTLDRSNFLA